MKKGLSRTNRKWLISACLIPVVAAAVTPIVNHFLRPTTNPESISQTTNVNVSTAAPTTSETQSSPQATAPKSHKHHLENKPNPESQIGSNYVPPAPTGFLADNSSNITCENCGIAGYPIGVNLRNGSHDIQFKDLTVTRSSPQATVETWKRRMSADAGEPKKIKEDLQWLREQVEPLWANDSPDIQPREAAQFQAMEDRFLQSASDKEATLQLLSEVRVASRLQ